MMSRAVLACLVIPLAGCSLISKLSPGKPSVPARPDVATPTPPDQPGKAATEANPGPKENTQGLPAKLIELVRENYASDPDRPGTEIPTRNNYYDAFRKAAGEFEVGWTEFEKRNAIVKPALAKALDAEKAGRHAEARKLLEAVISPTTVDAQGKIDPRARRPLDPRDAELPAVEAWVRACVALEDFKAVVEAGRHFVQRRKARDRETEMWFWLASAADAELGRLVSQSNPGIRHEVWKIYDEAAKVRGASPFDTEGQRLAGNYFSSLAQYGLPWTTVDVEKGKAGEWVMIRVEPVELKEREVKHASTQKWRVPKRCWDTSKVSWWDGNGKPVYEQQCEYDFFQRPITLSAKLVEALPAWAKGREMVLVVGRITGAGPAWKLTDAFLPDLRFSETGFLF